MSTEHATFTVERTYPVDPKRVWEAWTTEEGKRRWFTLPAPDVATDYRLDFGTSEHARTTFADGTVYDFDATYVDVVDGERFVSTYDMHCDGARISVSVATVELRPHGLGTTVTVTEQGVYLDGLDRPSYREGGVTEQLDKLGQSLA